MAVQCLWLVSNLIFRRYFASCLMVSRGIAIFRLVYYGDRRNSFAWRMNLQTFFGNGLVHAFIIVIMVIATTACDIQSCIWPFWLILSEWWLQSRMLIPEIHCEYVWVVSSPISFADKARHAQWTSIRSWKLSSLNSYSCNNVAVVLCS